MATIGHAAYHWVQQTHRGPSIKLVACTVSQQIVACLTIIQRTAIVWLPFLFKFVAKGKRILAPF